MTRVIGKSRAMEMVLTGEYIDSKEALKLGLVSKVVGITDLETEALIMAEKISQYSPLITLMNKDCVNYAYESSLKHGLEYERQVSWSTFATADQKEGMKAFSQKLKPDWKNK